MLRQFSRKERDARKFYGEFALVPIGEGYRVGGVSGLGAGKIDTEAFVKAACRILKEKRAEVRVAGSNASGYEPGNRSVTLSGVVRPCR